MALLLGLACDAVRAQDPAQPGTAPVTGTGEGASPAATAPSKSFLTIILEGAEWPGLFIGIMSIAAVSLLVEHFMTIRRRTMAPADEVTETRALIQAKRYRDCVEQLRGGRSMFAHLMIAGLQHGQHGFDAMYEAVDETAAAWSSRLFRRAEYLNIVGNLGPLMGLLGTVLGMIDAFSTMQATHGAYKTEDLAGGISLALVNTFLGLGLAIIGLGSYGVCRNRIDRFTVEARAAAVELLEYFRPLTGSAAATTTGATIGAVIAGNAVNAAAAAASAASQAATPPAGGSQASGPPAKPAAAPPKPPAIPAKPAAPAPQPATAAPPAGGVGRMTTQVRPEPAPIHRKPSPPNAPKR